jgi:hypothetical protein
MFSLEGVSEIEGTLMKRKLELNKEYPDPNEAALTKKLIALLIEMLKKSYLTGTTYRDTHAKGHCAVKGEFTIDSNLPPELNVGLFKQPGTYSCWIRFANLSPSPKPDRKGDVRSMSIKLMSVEGEMLWQDDPNAKTMDLIMMGSPRFLAPNLPQFYDLEVALDESGLSRLWFFLTHPRIFWTIFTAFKKCANLLEVPYFSQTAYLFGSRAVHYHIKSHQPAVSKIPRNASKNFLRERLVEQLATKDASFDFMIQFQTDAQKMPIEDANKEWKESLSPYRKVATIKIPSQRCDSPANVAFCENVSFNPWRTLPEHRPLGGINRARREVYPVISQFRHHRNEAPIKEPRSDGSYPDLSVDDKYVEPSGGVPAPSKAKRILPKIALAVLALLLVGGAYLTYRLLRPKVKPPYITDNRRLNDTDDKVLSEDERQRYYHLSQGSQIMPYAWFVSPNRPLARSPGWPPTILLSFVCLQIRTPKAIWIVCPSASLRMTPDPVTGVVNVD